MNNLKFRAWDKKLKEMARVVSLSFYDEKSPYKGGSTESFLYFPRLENTALRSFSEIVLEQYTGLKDKNGIEICVGDIVDTHDDEHNSSKLIIEFREGNYVGVDDNVGYEEPISNHQYKDWEVIGNVHENGELLATIYESTPAKR